MKHNTTMDCAIAAADVQVNVEALIPIHDPWASQQVHPCRLHQACRTLGYPSLQVDQQFLLGQVELDDLWVSMRVASQAWLCLLVRLQQCSTTRWSAAARQCTV
jgi:hypothetical protein